MSSRRCARWSQVVLGCVGVVLLGAAGCSSESSGGVVTPTTERSTSTSGPAGDGEEQAVLRAYHGYWDAVLEANDPPDQSHPALREHATGEAYESVFNSTQRNRLMGHAIRLPPDTAYEHRAEVVSIAGDTATVLDCAIDDGQLIDIDTGEVIDGDVVTDLVRAELVREDGTWKVTTASPEQSWEGIAGCAADA